MTSVLVDTNLLLLLAVGLTDKSLIARHKRLKTYEIEDFERVLQIVGGFSGLRCCPNVWSETSNLVRYIGEPASTMISTSLRSLIAQADEQFVDSRTATARPEYSRLGITDAVLLILAQSGSTLFSDDLPVCLAAARAGYTVINYNHVRAARYGF